MVERLITINAEGKKSMRATCEATLKAINRYDDNCPIIQKNDIQSILSLHANERR